MIKELWLRIKEILSWMILIACVAIVFICNQYSGYKLAEKDILKSCLSNNEFTIECLRLVCVRCEKDKKLKEKE